MWTKKYAPKLIEEFINKEQIKEIKKRILNKEKMILLHGNTGIGKTLSIYQIAKELDYEIIELNSSDFRKKNILESIVGEAIKQTSLFHKGKIILIDDVEALSGTKDKGATTSILNLAKKTTSSIILTTNNLYDDKISSIKKKAKIIEFKSPNYIEIFNILKNICEKEGISYEEKELKQLSRQHKDIRAAINDLQSINQNRKLDIKKLDERDTEETLINVLKIIFKSKEEKIIYEKTNNIDLRELKLWIEENLPLEYKGDDLIKGFEALSKADVFEGRIRKQQYWRFLVYQKYLLTQGVALSKKEKNNNLITYKRNSRLLKIWLNNQKNSKKNSIINKVALRTHNSTKKIKENFHFIKKILSKNNQGFDFTEEEINYLNTHTS